MRTTNAAMPSPAKPPSPATSALSRKSSRTRRPRPAPNAERIAKSRSLMAARASVRLATLTQAIVVRLTSEELQVLGDSGFDFRIAR